MAVSFISTQMTNFRLQFPKMCATNFTIYYTFFSTVDKFYKKTGPTIKQLSESMLSKHTWKRKQRPSMFVYILYREADNAISGGVIWQSHVPSRAVDAKHKTYFTLRFS